MNPQGLVMELAGDDEDRPFFNSGNETVFIGDSAGPIAGRVVLERFGLADPPDGVSRYVNDKM
jgi:hypothetical protein